MDNDDFEGGGNEDNTVVKEVGFDLDKGLLRSRTLNIFFKFFLLIIRSQDLFPAQGLLTLFILEKMYRNLYMSG